MDSAQAQPTGSDAGQAEPGSSVPAAAPAGAEATPAHNFAVQKDLHRQIRNDPDYDDWEYGTEPLPQEAWPASRTEG